MQGYPGNYSNVVIDSNRVIRQTDPNLPFPYQLQEPVREHIELSESFVIQGKRPDSIGGVVDVDEQESRTL